MRRFVFALLASSLLPTAAMAQDEINPPPPPGAMGAPDGGPPPGGGMGQGGPGMDSGHTGGMMQKMQARFTAANTTHDGHLTQAQAQAAGFDIVSANFAQIDTAHHGYVTFNDMIAWHLDQEAQRLEQKAASLRAQDK
jgi:hypothetical protein